MEEQEREHGRTGEGNWKGRRRSIEGQERLTGRAGEGAWKDRRW